jgi:uncharacterized protein
VSRIQRAFERRFRQLLRELGARQSEKGLNWLLKKADDLVFKRNLSGSQSLTELNIDLVQKVHRFRRRQGRGFEDQKAVHCDAGLGGLARWLRAIGCDAKWTQDITDSDLVREAELSGFTIITTDSFLLDRRPIASGKVRAIWVPPTLTRFEQLRLVRAELDLPALDSRCMRCGGELILVDKESVKDRIPPKTLLWVNDYYICARCGQLFWEGTHWKRITKKLLEVTLTG